MPAVSLTGKDTVIIDGRNFTALADGDVATLTFPNELVAVKTGKDGNSIYAYNTTGLQCDATIRVLRGSGDDKFLNARLAAMRIDLASFILITGTFIKRIGTGLGFAQNDTYVLSGGVITQQVDAASNVEGNTDQAVAVYRLKFTNAPRVIL